MGYHDALTIIELITNPEYIESVKLPQFKNPPPDEDKNAVTPDDTSVEQK